MKEDLMCFDSVPLAHGTDALKAVHKVLALPLEQLGIPTSLPAPPAFFPFSSSYSNPPPQKTTPNPNLPLHP